MTVKDFVKGNEKLPKELAEMLAETVSIWSNGAAYGYLIDAMHKAGFEDSVICKVRSCMKESMDELTVEEAEKIWTSW